MPFKLYKYSVKFMLNNKIIQLKNKYFKQKTFSILDSSFGK